MAVEALVRMHRKPEARTRANALLARFPRTPYVARLEGALGEPLCSRPREARLADHSLPDEDNRCSDDSSSLRHSSAYPSRERWPAARAELSWRRTWARRPGSSPPTLARLTVTSTQASDLVLPDEQVPRGVDDVSELALPLRREPETDPNNCGACGVVCPNRRGHGLFACIDGACQMTCTAVGTGPFVSVWANCNGSLDDDCEVELGTNENCRACGDACTDPQKPCIRDAAGMGKQCGCDPGMLYCDGECVDPRTSDGHCGGCGLCVIRAVTVLPRSPTATTAARPARVGRPNVKRTLPIAMASSPTAARPCSSTRRTAERAAWPAIPAKHA